MKINREWNIFVLGLRLSKDADVDSDVDTDTDTDADADADADRECGSAVQGTKFKVQGSQKYEAKKFFASQRKGGTPGVTQLETSILAQNEPDFKWAASLSLFAFFRH